MLVAVCLAVAGCSTTRPVAYSGLASSAHLESSAASDRIPYEYFADVNWGAYSNIIVDPVTIYRGNDHQFEKITEEDKKILARHMHEQFREKLGSRYNIVHNPGSGTLRIRLTLAGAKSTPMVLGTFLRFDVAGGTYNLVQSARGKEGALTGSVSYAVEIYDSSTLHLLGAYVGKQYPNAYNVKATLGSLDAAKVGIEKAAEDLLARLN